jgi:hypothetical protein
MKGPTVMPRTASIMFSRIFPTARAELRRAMVAAEGGTFIYIPAPGLAYGGREMEYSRAAEVIRWIDRRMSVPRIVRVPGNSKRNSHTFRASYCVRFRGVTLAQGFRSIRAAAEWIAGNVARTEVGKVHHTGPCPECARSFGPHYTGPCEH